MTSPEVIQLIGVVVSVLVILDALLKQVRDWRGGSPELRLLETSLRGTQRTNDILLNRLLELTR